MESPQIAKCGFSVAWVGKCENTKPCEEHASLKCCSCGDPATRECDQTGQFVCGAPLCDRCEHFIHEDGTNGGIGFNARPLPPGCKQHVVKAENLFGEF